MTPRPGASCLAVGGTAATGQPMVARVVRGRTGPSHHVPAGAGFLGSVHDPALRWRLFGSEPRVRRPVVLLVVFGVLLVLVGVTATAQAAMVSTYASTIRHRRDRRRRRGHAARLRRGRARGLRSGRAEPGGHRAPRRRARDAAREGRYRPRRDPDAGRPRHRVERSCAAGPVREASADFGTALAGSPSVAVVDAAAAEASGAAGLPATLIREYLPLRQGDQTVLVVGLWRDALPMLTPPRRPPAGRRRRHPHAPRSSPRASCTSCSAPRRSGSTARPTRSSRQPGTTRSPAR